jgi:2-C-methyl-D-erythritol 4-phosphate cytidylyltransferase
MTKPPRHWVVIPAAGAGRRFGGSTPKQYLRLAGRLVIDHSIACFIEHPAIAGCVVALSPADDWWAASAYAGHPRVWRADGGAERADSVGNALSLLAGQADAADWVLVHDAARPCLHPDDLNRLLAALADEPVGALLAVPMHDTVKLADINGGERSERTVPREHLWRACTPQAFRLLQLRQALADAAAQGLAVTDDAGAIELLGQKPRLIPCRPDNIKITRPDDLALAAFLIEKQSC